MVTNRNEAAGRVSLPSAAGAVRQQLPLRPTARPGRRRRDDVHQAVLQATIDLVDNPRIGFGGLTMEAVARRAHVSKATLYRWWPSKAHLLLDAYLAKAHRDVPVPDTGDLFTDLQRHLGHVAYAFAHLGTGRTLAEILLAANLDPGFGEQFRATLLDDRRRTLRLILDRALARGEVRPDADIEVAIDMAYGAVHHRLLVSHAEIDGPFMAALARVITDAVGLRPR